MDGGACEATVQKVAKSWAQLSDFTFIPFYFFLLRIGLYDSAMHTYSECIMNNNKGWHSPLNKKTIQFSSVWSLSCPTLCNPMNRSTPGLPVHHQLPEFTQTHVHRVGDAIQPSHPLSSPSPPAPNPSQHQGLFQWVNSSHVVAKALEF